MKGYAFPEMKLELLMALAVFFPVCSNAQAPLAAENPAGEREGEAATDFIRVDEDENAARLQTAVTTYTKDGVTLDLIGAVHIADEEYYEALNARFDQYPVLLFEMIGGENVKEMLAAEHEARQNPGAVKKNAGGLSALGNIYQGVARFLELTDQKSGVDYDKAHFVHADLTLQEFQELQEERNESILSFMLKAARANALKPQARQKQPDLGRLFSALLAGNASALKLEIVHTLGQGDDQISAFTGDSVIITDRNAKCLRVLDEQIAKGHKKVGVFYGAAHYPDMEKTLLGKGWKRTGHEWMTAWDIPKKTQPKPRPKKQREESELEREAA